MFDFWKRLAIPLRWPLARRPGDAAALAEKEAALAALFEIGAAGIAEVDLVARRFLRLNARFCEFWKRPSEELLMLAPSDLVHPEDRVRVYAQWMEAMRGVGRWEGEVRHVGADGAEFWLRVGVTVSKRDAAGQPLRCISVVQDVTDSVQRTEQLRHEEELLRLGQRIGRIGTFERDLVTGRVHCSAETRMIAGLGRGERVKGGRDWLAIFLAEDRPRLTETIAAALARRDEEIAVESRIRRADDGAIRHIEMRARYYYDADGRPLRSVGVMIDVTERKEAEERLAYAARHDSLTGLGNRDLFREALAEAAERARGGESFAVLCLDLDRFKDVNDTLGHPAGDQLLREAAARFQGELRPGDTLARLGGDEFAIIQSNVADPAEAGDLAARLVARLAESFTVAGQRVGVGVSVGVAVAPRDGASAEELLSAADLALYKAKREPTRGWRFFEPEMNAAARARRELETDLRLAVENDEFELFYQPMLHVGSLQVDRFEALIRWRHPTRGLVAPDRFIPACEEIGLIADLGAWVIRQACRETRGWSDRVGVAVNVSAVQFACGGLEQVVEAALAENGLDPRRLELEITETALLNDSEATLATLRRLKALGVHIAIDDFGAGHSSLGYLQLFPFDKVKIDRAFAQTVDRSPRSAAIVKAMIDLCRALGLATAIEGVETASQFEALARMGGETVQGYLFSPPRAAAEAPGLIAAFADAARKGRAA